MRRSSSSPSLEVRGNAERRATTSRNEKKPATMAAPRAKNALTRRGTIAGSMSARPNTRALDKDVPSKQRIVVFVPGSAVFKFRTPFSAMSPKEDSKRPSGYRIRSSCSSTHFNDRIDCEVGPSECSGCRRLASHIRVASTHTAGELRASQCSLLGSRNGYAFLNPIKKDARLANPTAVVDEDSHL